MRAGRLTARSRGVQVHRTARKKVALEFLSFYDGASASPDFANGAMTGAFAWAFNQSLHRESAISKGFKWLKKQPIEHVWPEAKDVASRIAYGGEPFSAIDMTGDGVAWCAELAQSPKTVGAPETDAWIEGRRLTYGMDVPSGTLIATFGSTGKYLGEHGHAAFLIGWRDGTAVVVDQYPPVAGGSDFLHYRPLNTTGVNDWRNFSTVKFPIDRTKKLER